jgi:hypothetical protein
MISFSQNASYNSLSLLLFGEDLDPREVDSGLGISATKSYKKGDPFSLGKHQRKNGMWCLELKGEGTCPSDDLKRFVETVGDQLFPISKIKGVTSGKLLLWLDNNDKNTTFELSIDADYVELINKFGVQFYLTAFPKIDDQ